MDGVKKVKEWVRKLEKIFKALVARRKKFSSLNLRKKLVPRRLLLLQIPKDLREELTEYLKDYTKAIRRIVSGIDNGLHFGMKPEVENIREQVKNIKSPELVIRMAWTAIFGKLLALLLDECEAGVKFLDVVRDVLAKAPPDKQKEVATFLIEAFDNLNALMSVDIGYGLSKLPGDSRYRVSSLHDMKESLKGIKDDTVDVKGVIKSIKWWTKELRKIGRPG